MSRNLYYDDVKVIKKPLKSRLKAFAIFFMAIIVCVGCYMVSIYFSDALAVGNVGSYIMFGGVDIKIDKHSLYAVTLGEYNDKGQADGVAIGSAVQGASGYVWEEKNFTVMGSIYPSKEEAEIVLNNLKDSKYTLGVKVIEFPKIKISYENLENSEVKKIRDALDIIDEIYNTFYRNSISFDKSEITNLVISNNASNLRSEVKVCISTMQRLINGENSSLSIIQNALIQLDELLNQTVLNTIENDSVGHKIKNALCRVVKIKYDLYQELSK